MDLILLFTLSLCCWTAAGRSYWTDKPAIIVSSDEIKEGETLKVSCTVPMDYLGGDCRLFRGDSDIPFRLKTAMDYICVFNLKTAVLLGDQPVGSEVSLKCDYHNQNYVSQSSDGRTVIVWGSRPSPGLSVSRRIVSPNDSVEVTCSPPLSSVSRCHFYRDQVFVSKGPCSRNITGRELGIWEKPTLLLPVNLTCTYDPHPDLHIRSEHSNHLQLLVVDASRVTSSVDCKVPVSDDQLEAFGDGRWTSGGATRPTVTIQVMKGSLALNETCS